MDKGARTVIKNGWEENGSGFVDEQWKKNEKAQPRQGCRRVTPRYVRHVIICLNRLVNQCTESNGHSVKKNTHFLELLTHDVSILHCTSVECEVSDRKVWSSTKP